MPGDFFLVDEIIMIVVVNTKTKMEANNPVLFLPSHTVSKADLYRFVIRERKSQAAVASKNNLVFLFLNAKWFLVELLFLSKSITRFQHWGGVKPSTSNRIRILRTSCSFPTATHGGWYKNLQVSCIFRARWLDLKNQIHYSCGQFSERF